MVWFANGLLVVVVCVLCFVVWCAVVIARLIVLLFNIRYS